MSAVVPFPASPQGTLDLFHQRLPKAPYHTDDVGCGLRIAYRDQAARSLHIQPNGPTHHYWLVYDVDRSGAAVDWNDRNAPPPTIVARNPKNGHAHLLYGLSVPVRTAPGAKSGPLRYMAAVDCALREQLDADAGYSGLICKNPLRKDVWGVSVWESRLYELGDLDSWLDLDPYKDRRKRLPDYGLGRNCNLFESLRKWAYRAIRQGWPDYERWFQAVLQRAEGYNAQFPEPLALSEVKHTAKSVAKWTHANLSPEGFRAVQATRGRRGGQAKGAKVRDELVPQVLELFHQGVPQAEIARRLEVSRQNVSNWLKRELSK